VVVELHQNPILNLLIQIHLPIHLVVAVEELVVAAVVVGCLDRRDMNHHRSLLPQLDSKHLDQYNQVLHYQQDYYYQEEYNFHHRLLL
jgi:hypothetical protein